MDSKKIVARYIRPNWIATLILMLIPIIGFFALIVLLTGTLPTLSKANKNLKKLEEKGLMEQAASELVAEDSKKLMKGKVVLGANFLFCKATGYVFTYDEILWAYRHRLTNSVFFIPVKVTDSLYLAAKGMKPRAVASMGKDKEDEIKTAILEIYEHNNSCLVGYNKEIAAQYKELTDK